MSTYSFLDTVASITGPGGGAVLGTGAQSAEEGITITPNADINTLTVGADGASMNSLRANYSGTITVRLLKTSPINSVLMMMANYQRSSSTLHGRNVINVVNTGLGDDTTATAVAFKRIPDLTYAVEGGLVEWQFDAGKILPTLGAAAAV